MLKKIVYSAAIVWTIVIAVLCLVKFGKLPSLGVSGLDKYVHFTFHFVFTMLWGYYYGLNQQVVHLKVIMRIVIVSLLYGILIEFLQETCTTTRHADIYDVLANLSGALTSFLCFFMFKRIKEK